MPDGPAHLSLDALCSCLTRREAAKLFSQAWTGAGPRLAGWASSRGPAAVAPAAFAAAPACPGQPPSRPIASCHDPSPPPPPHTHTTALMPNQFLVLASADFVRGHQQEPYGDISLTRGAFL